MGTGRTLARSRCTNVRGGNLGRASPPLEDANIRQEASPRTKHPWLTWSRSHRHPWVGFSSRCRSPDVAGSNGIGAVPTNFYVDSTAPCPGSGTQTSPWCDFSVVNSETFQPGDQILLKSGDTFTSGMNLVGSGTSTSYVTVASYGSGAPRSSTAMTTPALSASTSITTVTSRSKTSTLRTPEAAY